MKPILAAALAAAVALGASLGPTASGAQSLTGGSAGGFGGALNAVRAQAGLPGLSADRRLAAAAQAYAERMARTGHVQHVGADGSTQVTRAQAAGCRTRFVGENIAWGIPTTQAVFDGWMASAGHRANMLGPHYGVFGLGQAGGMWVILFADRC